MFLFLLLQYSKKYLYRSAQVFSLLKHIYFYFFRPVNNRLSTGILADIFFNTMLVTSDTASKIM